MTIANEQLYRIMKESILARLAVQINEYSLWYVLPKHGRGKYLSFVFNDDDMSIIINKNSERIDYTIEEFNKIAEVFSLKSEQEAIDFFYNNIYEIITGLYPNVYINSNRHFGKQASSERIYKAFKLALAQKADKVVDGEFYFTRTGSISMDDQGNTFIARTISNIVVIPDDKARTVDYNIINRTITTSALNDYIELPDNATDEELTEFIAILIEDFVIKPITD